MLNWTIIEGTWRVWKAPALSWWERLTDDEWEEIDGSREKLIELLGIKYGWTRQQTEQEVKTRFDEYEAELEEES